MPKRNGQNPSSIRINNHKIVLDIVRQSKSITVTQISDKILLSKTTLWKIIDHFLEQNLVINRGKAKASDDGGKRPELYAFNNAYGYVISITIYGSFILLALTDAGSQIYYKETVFLHENESLERVIGIVSAFIKKWQEPENLPTDRRSSKLLGIVIAASGVIDNQKGICFTASRFNAWPAEARIKELIKEQVTLKAPFYIDNYNRFFAVAEKELGGFFDKKNIVDVVAVHDGLGAGIIAENKIKRGPRFLTGEIGHICLNPFYTDRCHCGGHGCFEQLVSSELLLKQAFEHRDDHADSLIYQNSNATVTLQDIFKAADKEDNWARELLDEVIKWFAIGFQNILYVFNPEVIIISGDYRHAGEYFKQKLLSNIDNLSLVRMKKNIVIEYSKFDEEGALLGGASYVIHDYFNNRHEY